MWIEVKNGYHYECWREAGKKRRRYLGKLPPNEEVGGRAEPPRHHRAVRQLAPTMVAIGDSVLLIHGSDAAEVAALVYARCSLPVNHE